MRRFPLSRWIPLGAILVLTILPLAGWYHLSHHTVEAASAPAPLAETDHTTTVLANPASPPPSPFLAAASLAIKVPVAELGGFLPLARAATQCSNPSYTATRTSSIVHTRLRVLRLRHDIYAASGLAARAGLLSRKATIPPLPIG
jgi:hypothetical protein